MIKFEYFLSKNKFLRENGENAEEKKKREIKNDFESSRTVAQGEEHMDIETRWKDQLLESFNMKGLAKTKNRK